MRFWSGEMLFSGTYSFWFSWSTRTAWRWLKVPRWQSSPDRRTRWPSISNVPKASASPVAQSMPLPLSTATRLASSWRAILGLRLKPSGAFASARPTVFSISGATPVASSVHSLSFSGCPRPLQCPSSQSALFTL